MSTGAIAAQVEVYHNNEITIKLASKRQGPLVRVCGAPGLSKYLRCELLIAYLLRLYTIFLYQLMNGHSQEEISSKRLVDNFLSSNFPICRVRVTSHFGQ